MMILFIPALLTGNLNEFLTKIAIVVLMWFIVIGASMIDLITGISASRRMGMKKTTSWGLRKTLTKDLQYLAMLVMFLVIDILLSALSPHLSLFASPLLSIMGTIAITIIETISVIENTRKGKSKQDDKVDDIQQLITSLTSAIGTEKTKLIIKVLQEYKNKIECEK